MRWRAVAFDDRCMTRLSPVALTAVIAALFASSALCAALLLFRVARTDTIAYGFMAWNLPLAWMALLFALPARYAAGVRSPMRVSAALLAGALWLLFFPNAPYVVTDIAHVRIDPAVPFWYDALLVAVFVSTGLTLGMVSLLLMQDVVSGFAGRAGGWLFALAALGLCSLGIYLGRVLRWNSWDAIASPYLVFRDVAAIVAHPGAHTGAWSLIVLFTLFLAAAYVAFYALTRLHAGGGAVDARGTEASAPVR